MWQTSQAVPLHGPPSFEQTGCTALVTKCCPIHPLNLPNWASSLPCATNDDLLLLVTIQGIKHSQIDISRPRLPVTADVLKALPNCEIGHITYQLRKACFGLHSLWAFSALVQAKNFTDSSLQWSNV